MARFAIFGGNYWPEAVGISQYTTAYAEALVAAGHDVTVVCGYPHYPQWTAEHVRPRVTASHRHGVRLLRVPHAVPSTPGARGRLGLELTFGLSSALVLQRLGRFDAAIAMVPPLAGGLAAAAAARARRRPFGVLVQDLVSAAAAQGGVPGAGQLVGTAVTLAERLIFRADRVGVVARGFEEPVRRLGAREVDYLPNFTHTARAGDRARGRSLLDVEEDAFLVLYSGNLGYKQDFTNVLDAARRLGPTAGLALAIVGEGAQRAEIAAALAGDDLRHVTLHPLQPAEAVPDVLAAADLLLAPQRATEVDMSVPSKLTTYLAAGRPVVAAASAASETARIVEESGAGLVVPPAVPQALAEALRMLRADPARRDEQARAARAYAERVFAAGPALQRFVAFAERLAAPP